MKKKIIGMLVCTLLIGATGIAVADWEEGDGHKMHFPQLPDPNGWDIEISSYGPQHECADDWMCSETGPVNDIHFWISIAGDGGTVVHHIQVNIYDNDPGGPYSQPGNPLWNRTFNQPEFSVRLYGTGDQGFADPQLPFWTLHDHKEYHQVNIENIEDPFIQQEGEIYWLGIYVWWDNPPQEPVGWKTADVEQYPDPYTGSPFMDTAVYRDYTGQWVPLIDPYLQEPLDFAFVITGEEHACNLAIRSVTGGLLVTPSSTTVDAVLANTGTAPCVNVSWSFTFNGGIIISGPNNGVIPNIPPAGTATISSKLVIGLAVPFLLPATVTVTATCPPAPPVTITKNVLVILLLWNVS